MLSGCCVKVYCALKSAKCKEDVSLYCFQVSRYLFYSFYAQYVNRYSVVGQGLIGLRVSCTCA